MSNNGQKAAEPQPAAPAEDLQGLLRGAPPAAGAAFAPTGANPMLEVVVGNLREFLGFQHQQAQQTADFLQAQQAQLIPAATAVAPGPTGRAPQGGQDELLRLVQGLSERMEALASLPQQVQDLQQQVREQQDVLATLTEARDAE